MTGIIVNDQVNDYSWSTFHNVHGVPEGVANQISPNKRAMSSMSPVIMTDEEGNVQLAAGAAGGVIIPNVLSQVSSSTRQSIHVFGMCA